jgi:hypothetical protein
MDSNRWFDDAEAIKRAKLLLDCTKQPREPGHAAGRRNLGLEIFGPHWHDPQQERQRYIYVRRQRRKRRPGPRQDAGKQQIDDPLEKQNKPEK